MIHSIKTFYKKCKRFIEFAPEIWNGNDYDYQSAVDLFSYQLERLADELESKNPHVDTKHQVARIHATVEMIQKVYGEEYLERPLHIMERMYGECSFSFKPFEDTDSFEVELANSHGHRKLGLVDGFSPANKLGHGLHPLMLPRRGT